MPGSLHNYIVSFRINDNTPSRVKTQYRVQLVCLCAPARILVIEVSNSRST